MELPQSLLANICFGILAFFIIALNLWLFSAWRHRKNPENQEWLHRMGQGLKDPWSAENSQMQELSKRVTELQGKSSNKNTNRSNWDDDD